MTWEQSLEQDGNRMHFAFSIVVGIVLPMWIVFDYFSINNLWSVIAAARIFGSLLVLISAYLLHTKRISYIIAGHIFNFVLYFGVGAFLSYLSESQITYWCIGYSTCFITSATFQTWSVRHHLASIVGNFVILSFLWLQHPQNSLSVYISNGLLLTISVAIVSSAFYFMRMSFLKRTFILSNENQKLMDRLVENEKMASLGRLTAGLSHEINTPLGICLTEASTTVEDINQHIKKENISDKELLIDIKQSSERIVRNIGKASELVNKFKLVSVSQISDIKRIFDIPEIVKACADSYVNKLKKAGVVVNIQCDSKSTVYGDPGLISQLIMCLFDNAIMHAFEGVTDPKIGVSVQEENKDAVILFEDNGIGMDAETKKKAFEPFFTTKLGKGGSGLGLNIAYNIAVHAFNGSIEIESAPGKGTRFSIRLSKESTHE